jgi:hypothetical protein
VYCYAEKVPSTQSDAFKDSYIEYATLHVPNASLESYKNTAPWSGFGTKVGLSGGGGGGTETPKCATPTISYNNGKLSFASATEGADDGTQVSIYNTAGQMAGSAVSSNGHATVFTNLEPGTIAIVKIGSKSVKVVMK